MTKEIKTMTFIGLLGALFISLGTTLVTGTSILPMNAICTHEGNHYTAKNASRTQTGVKEYWVCCKCHEHFLENPSGYWTEAGTANITIDSSDNRFIPKTNEYDSSGIKYSSDGKTVTGFDTRNGDKNVVIPEGVTDIGTVFAGTNITSITIPSSVATIEGGAFRECNKLTSVTITEGVQEIESTGSYPFIHGAFQGCDNLSYVVIPSTVTQMDAYEFAGGNSKLVIYCVAASKPSGWSQYWNYNQQIGGSALKTYWGLNSGWHYDANGVPTKGAN